MHDVETEQRLPGGGLGGALRSGNTVIRAAGPWTPTVHALLEHLNSAGLDAVPQPLGLDKAGRELTSYIAGQTVYTARQPNDDGWPAWAYADGLLIQAAEWLARYHQAVQDFRPTDPHWRSGRRPLGPDEIVCHYDFRASNIIVDGIDPATTTGTPRLIGVVDWDTAGPGRPIFDLALTAWNWVPLWHVPDRTDAEVARRLRLLASAYGTFTPQEILAAVPDRLDAATQTSRAIAKSGDQAMRALINPDDPRPMPSIEARSRLQPIFKDL